MWKFSPCLCSREFRVGVGLIFKADARLCLLLRWFDDGALALLLGMEGVGE